MKQGHSQLLSDIEVHSVEGLNTFFQSGGDPNAVYNSIPLFTTMVEMYLRSAMFKECVRVFIKYGLDFEDQPLLAVLSDDAAKLQHELKKDPELVHRRYSTFRNAFTSLEGATLLHYCAEYNHLECAKVLLHYGADINARAGFDENGFDGQTPIFHAVAQHNNNSLEILQLLLDNGAEILVAVKGLVWGKGYEWETFIPTVNPLGYTMMGLLPQMHRDELYIANNISLLLLYAYGLQYTLPNIPNQYLKG